MIEKEIIELFLNKKIVFIWKSGDKTYTSSGFLKRVTDSSIVIEFYNKPQTYSLDSIITVREFEEKPHKSYGERE